MHLVRTAAALGAAALLLSACGGGSSNTGIPPGTLQNGVGAGTTVPATVKIVGVGDSLTQGTQSDGTTGAPVNNSAYTDPSYGQYANAPASQPNGFFALLWEQANGVTASTITNPATSPMALIAPPGIGGTLVPTSSGFPSATPATVSCQGTQAAAYSLSGALGDRLNPKIQQYDVAVPGMTTHEVLAMTGPLSSCVTTAQQAQLAQTAAGRQQLALNQLVGSESVDFYPVLAPFGAGITQLQAATSLHGQYATVWIGSNDLLHFAEANGAAPAATPASVGQDITQIIQQLQASGAKVAVANLVDVLGAATFFPIGTDTGATYTTGTNTPTYEQSLAKMVDDAIVAKAAASFPPGTPLSYIIAYPPVAAQINGANQEAYGFAKQQITTAQLGSAGYMLLPVTLQTAAAILTGGTAPAVDAPGAGNNGAGEYVSDAVAGQVKALDAGYDQAIAAAATATGAALVDAASSFATAEANEAAGTPTVVDAQGDTVNLTYGGGYFSYDGLHPSNTGYAVTANLWIQAFNTKYGTAWPAVDVHSIYTTDPYAPQNFAVIHAHARAAR